MELTTYDDVNGAWGDRPLPPITAERSRQLFGKLVRHFGGREIQMPSYSFKANRSWAAPKGTDTTKPRQNGMPRMVHDASHWVFGRLHPGFKTHSAAHAELERDMIRYALEKGWTAPLSPAKPEATVDMKRAAKLASQQARLKRWLTKRKRADTAIAKLTRSIRRLSR